MMQVKCANGEWVDIGEIGDGGLIEYRRKPPEVKPDVVKKYWFNGIELKECTEPGCTEKHVVVTLCGETGELLTAEVLK